MLLDPEIRSADARHRHIQNVVGEEADFLRLTAFQAVVDIDATDNRFRPARVPDQNHAIHLRFRGKTTAVKDRLNWSYVALKLNDAGLLHLAAHVNPPWRVLRHRHYHFGIAQSR